MVISPSFKTVQPGDESYFNFIADWYFQEWKMPVERTKQRLDTITRDKNQFQIILFDNDKPVCTGGMYTYVSIFEKLPHLSVHKHWLALLYTVPDKRELGYGALLCRYLEQKAKAQQVEKLTLFTDTAESLYQRLGWKVTERVVAEGRHIAIMQKDLI